MNIAKIKFPIKGLLFPPQHDNCPICGKDIRQGQVILMLGGASSIHNHFHETENFIGVEINDETCDLYFCSTNCIKDFFLNVLAKLEPKNPCAKTKMPKEKL